MLRHFLYKFRYRKKVRSGFSLFSHFRHLNQMVSTGLAFVSALVAVLCFGSNFIPVKQYDTGDGMFFQFVMCNAIFVVGVIVNAIQGFPAFEPLALIGGFVWATGNVLVVPIVKHIGLGLGLLVWGGANLITGWCTGHFGWFGLPAESVENPALNIVGFVIAVLSMLAYFFVDTTLEASSEEEAKSIMMFVDQSRSHYKVSIDSISVHSEADIVSRAKRSMSIASASSGRGRDNSYAIPYGDDNADLERRLMENFPRNGNEDPLSPSEQDFGEEKQTPFMRQVIGFGLAAVAGICYGVNFVPAEWRKSHGGSKEGLDYVFSQFTGIYLASLFYFLVYSALMKNKPRLYPEIILPGMICGMLWAIADVFWFVAIDGLQFVVSYPLVTTGPGVVGSLWGIFLFQEIQGTRNLMRLAGAICLTVIGVAFIAMSKLL